MLRVGLIGIGGHSRAHQQAISALAEQVRAVLVCACDNALERVGEQAAALRAQGAEVYGELDAMLAAAGGRVDVMGIPAGIASHRPLTVRCLEAGFHVIVEKPPAATIQDVDAMIAAARRTGRLCLVHFQSWWFSPVRALKQAIADGRLGAIRRVTVHALWRRLDNYYQRNDWAGQIKHHGQWVLDGTINNPLAHQINNILYFASTSPTEPATPVRVRAELYHAHEIAAEDTSSVLIETDTGAVCQAALTTCTASGHEGPLIEVTGSKGSATLDPDRKLVLRPDGEGSQTVEADVPREHVGPVYADVADHFEGRPAGLHCTIARTRAFMLAVNGAWESSRGAHAIDPAYVTREPAGESVQTTVAGLDDLVRRSVADGKTFSELGAPWATPTDWFDLDGYRSFEPDWI